MKDYTAITYRKKKFESASGKIEYKWRGRFYYTDGVDYFPKEHGYYKNKFECRDACIRIREQLTKEATEKRLADVGDGTPTFADLYEKYVEYQKTRLASATLVTYDYMWVHIKESLGNVHVGMFTPDVYDEIKDELNETDLSTNRKNKIHQFIGCLMKYAFQRYGIVNDTLQRCGNFGNFTESRNMQFYTYEEFCQYINACDSMYDTPVSSTTFRILYYQGIRKGELFGLTWRDIDFKARTMSINRQIDFKTKKGGYLVKPPKKNSYRTLPIEDETFDWIIKTYEYWKTKKNFSEDWYVVGGDHPMHVNTLEEKNIRICRKAELKHISIHSFRHSCASLYFQTLKQYDGLIVQKLLGHKNLNTTLNIYVHMMPNQVNIAMSALRELKNSAPNFAPKMSDSSSN